MSSHPQASAPSWSRQEFAGLDLGDTRLNDRRVNIADALAGQPLSPIRTACGDSSSVKAAYRFFDNDKVSAEKVLDPHFQQTVERMRGYERVFAIQDTTYLDYTDHPATQGLGPIGKRSQNYQGLVKHTTLVVSASGLPLGCLTEIHWHAKHYENTDKARPMFPSRNGQGLQRMSRRAAHNVLKSAFETAGLNGHLATHSLRKSFVQGLYERTYR